MNQCKTIFTTFLDLSHLSTNSSFHCSTNLIIISYHSHIIGFNSTRIITQKNTTPYKFIIFLYYFGPATTVRQNQHLLMHRAPTLYPGPCLVFLDPAKKGLRYPNLKSKTSLLLQYSILVSHKRSLSHQGCSSSLLITSTLLYHCSLLLINLCTLVTVKSSRSAQQTLLCSLTTAQEASSILKSSLLLPCQLSSD